MALGVCVHSEWHAHVCYRILKRSLRMACASMTAFTPRGMGVRSVLHVNAVQGGDWTQGFENIYRRYLPPATYNLTPVHLTGRGGGRPQSQPHGAAPAGVRQGGGAEGGGEGAGGRGAARASGHGCGGHAVSKPACLPACMPVADGACPALATWLRLLHAGHIERTLERSPQPAGSCCAPAQTRSDFSQDVGAL